MKSFEEFVATNDLYTDDADRIRLEQLPETQREKVLYERYCTIKEAEEKRQIRSMALAEERTEPPQQMCQKHDLEECDFVFTKDDLIRNVFKPSFPAFKDCFVRAKLGSEYQICKIVGFSKVEPYSLHPRKNERTSIALQLDSGTKKIMKFEIFNVSSQGVEEEEFEKFIQVFRITSLDKLRMKYRKTRAEVMRKLTDKEHDIMLANRERDNPRKKGRAAMKIELILKRDAAVASKNKELAHCYQKQLEKMENEEREAKRRNEEEKDSEAKRRLAREDAD